MSGLKKLFSIKNRKVAFTLAEVLITLGIIGVVAAMVLPTIITNIQNKGYVEALKKNYSILQQVTNTIIQEEGTPDTWIFTKHNSDDNSANQYIVSNYVKHLQTFCYRLSRVAYSGDATFCDGTKFLKPKNVFKNLDGSSGTDLYGQPLFVDSYPAILTDGTLLGIRFGVEKGATYWGNPPMHFIVDVNGWKGPNVVGRDIFFFYLMNNKSGKVLPYVKEVSASDVGWTYQSWKSNTCEKGKTGHSCAYRIITEGKMNY